MRLLVGIRSIEQLRLRFEPRADRRDDLRDRLARCPFQVLGMELAGDEIRFERAVLLLDDVAAVLLGSLDDERFSRLFEDRKDEMLKIL